jgi:UPF0755 protein
MFRRIALSSIAAILFTAVVAVVVLRSRREWRTPPLASPHVIEVVPGESILALSQRLADRGIVRDEALFATIASWRGVDRRIRTGEYEFHGGANLVEVLDHLVSGPQRQRLVVIPEGLTAVEIARLLEAQGHGRAADLERLCRDPAFAEKLGIPAPGLEGFLFPDSYAFARGTPAEEILARMTRRFWEVFTPEMRVRATASGLSVLEAVTLASLIEEEAAVAEERPVISAVFHNRLARGMRLQSDPTAVYGADRSGPVRRSDLERPSPYNTYRIKGLPPGPIANPGRASLEAAVRPAPGIEAIYFVSRNDRTHEFNESLRDHERAVGRYQRTARPPNAPAKNSSSSPVPPSSPRAAPGAAPR